MIARSDFKDLNESILQWVYEVPVYSSYEGGTDSLDIHNNMTSLSKDDLIICIFTLLVFFYGYYGSIFNTI